MMPPLLWPMTTGFAIAFCASSFQKSAVVTSKEFVPCSGGRPSNPGKVNAAVNRIRRLKHRLSALAGGAEDDKNGLAAKVKAAAEQLTAVEAVLVDIHREAPRDVLRNPAGLNDTLLALISQVSMSDAAPTRSSAAVANEISARVDAEIGKLERLAATEVAVVNRLALGREVEVASSG